MSFPFNAKISRSSNGTIELTPDTQTDLLKVDVGQSVTVDLVVEKKPAVPKKKSTRKSKKSKK